MRGEPPECLPSVAGGRPPEVDEIVVVVATLVDEGRPPEKLGA
jgi:hypothetical protein